MEVNFPNFVKSTCVQNRGVITEQEKKNDRIRSQNQCRFIVVINLNFIKSTRVQKD